MAGSGQQGAVSGMQVLEVFLPATDNRGVVGVNGQSIGTAHSNLKLVVGPIRSC